VAQAGHQPQLSARDALGEDARVRRVDQRVGVAGDDERQKSALALAAGGGEGVFVGVIPTPGIAYLCRTSDASAAISISASHNPYADNGVKIFGHDGMKIPDAVEEEIEDEMRAIEQAQTAGDAAKIPGLMSERWLKDVTLFGSAAEVREGIEAWYAAGIKTPIIVPSSASGGQMKAFEEVFAALG